MREEAYCDVGSVTGVSGTQGYAGTSQFQDVPHAFRYDNGSDRIQNCSVSIIHISCPVIALGRDERGIYFNSELA